MRDCALSKAVYRLDLRRDHKKKRERFTRRFPVKFEERLMGKASRQIRGKVRAEGPCKVYQWSIERISRSVARVWRV